MHVRMWSTVTLLPHWRDAPQCSPLCVGGPAGEGGGGKGLPARGGSWCWARVSGCLRPQVQTCFGCVHERVCFCVSMCIHVCSRMCVYVCVCVSQCVSIRYLCLCVSVRLCLCVCRREQGRARPRGLFCAKALGLREGAQEAELGQAVVPGRQMKWSRNRSWNPAPAAVAPGPAQNRFNLSQRCPCPGGWGRLRQGGEQGLAHRPLPTPAPLPGLCFCWSKINK